MSYAPAPSPEGPPYAPTYGQQAAGFPQPPPTYQQPQAPPTYTAQPPAYAQAQPGTVGFAPQPNNGPYAVPIDGQVGADPAFRNRKANHPKFFSYMNCFMGTESYIATVTFGCVIALMVILLAQDPDVACCAPRIGTGDVNAGSVIGGSDISCQTKFWDNYDDAAVQITGLSNHPFMCSAVNTGFDAEGDNCVTNMAAFNLVPASNFTDYAGCKAQCEDTSNKAPKWGAILFAFALLDALFCCWKFKAFIRVWNATSEADEKQQEKKALKLTIISVSIKILALIIGILVGGIGGFSEFSLYSISDDKCEVSLVKGFPNGNSADGFELQTDVLEQLRHVKSTPIAVMAFLSGVFFILGIVLAVLGFCIGRMALKKPKEAPTPAPQEMQQQPQPAYPPQDAQYAPPAPQYAAPQQ